MKINIVLALIAVGLGYATCKNFSKQETPAAAANESGLTPISDLSKPQINGFKQEQASDRHAAHILGSNPDTAPPVQVRRVPDRVNVNIEAVGKASASRKAYLGTGWWHCNMAMSAVDSTIHVNYKPKFMKFREDQTFDVLIKGKVVDTGRWAYDDAKNQIHLSCKDNYLNNSWQVQDKGFVMIWKGNTDLNSTGIQVRVICSKLEPKWDEM
jgi:hypothetical protein